MRSKLSLGLGAVVCIVAVAIWRCLPWLRARGHEVEPTPGDAANGKKVYIQFCGKCHALKAAGARGTLGPNLDHVKVSYCACASIEEGVGGIQAEYVLRNVTFSQVYDVAKYVVTYRAASGTSAKRTRPLASAPLGWRDERVRPRGRRSAPQQIWEAITSRSVHGEHITLALLELDAERRRPRAQPRERAGRVPGRRAR